jgi:hypothetical protein
VSGHPKAVSAGHHCAPPRAALGVGAPTSDIARHLLPFAYAPVSVFCVVKANPPALVLWPRRRGAPLASVDSRGSPFARLPLFALCPSRAGGGGMFDTMYHSCTIYPMPLSLD